MCIHSDSEGFSVRRVPKISLLELMQCSNTSHSAESTAQRLLQYIATQYSGVDPEDLTATQTVSHTHPCIHVYIHVCTCFDERREGRKKETRSNKQTNKRQSNTAHPRQSLTVYMSYMYMYLGWDSNPRHVHVHVHVHVCACIMS